MSKTLFLTFLLASLLTVQAQENPMLIIGKVEMNVGETYAIPVILTNVGDISGYSIELTIDNPRVAEFIDVKYKELNGIDVKTIIRKQGVIMSAVDENDTAKGNILLGNVVVKGIGRGTTAIRVENIRVDDDDGNSIDVLPVTGEVTVKSKVGKPNKPSQPAQFPIHIIIIVIALLIAVVTLYIHHRKNVI